MSRRSRSLPLVLFAVFIAWGLGACSERASGETQAGAAKPSRVAKSPCPTKEQVSEAVGFEVMMRTELEDGRIGWIGCQYEMTGRYRGTFLEVFGDPASKADSVFGELKQATKGMKGMDAEPDRIDVGSGGWAFGSNSVSAAAAVAGSRVWQAKLEYLMSGSIGDQKEAMVRVLKLVAR